MIIMFNAGSENIGGTFEQAKNNAKMWLKSIHNDGFKEVVMSFDKVEDGNYIFNFTHLVTGVKSYLRIHGFTNEEYQQFKYPPRTYWNGCSVSEPCAEDWLTNDFNYKVVYYKKEKENE